jgi:hypothetical protein
LFLWQPSSRSAREIVPVKGMKKKQNTKIPPVQHHLTVFHTLRQSAWRNLFIPRILLLCRAATHTQIDLQGKYFTHSCGKSKKERKGKRVEDSGVAQPIVRSNNISSWKIKVKTGHHHKSDPPTFSPFSNWYNPFAGGLDYQNPSLFMFQYTYMNCCTLL